MPIHNWKNAPPGLFHHFHQEWTVRLCSVLNKSVLPSEFFAMIEQKAVGVEPDVMTLKGVGASAASLRDRPSGIALAEARPKVFYTTQVSDQIAYARKANRISVRTTDGELVAVIEFVSPGNKHDKSALDKFVDTAVRFLQSGV